MPSTDEKAALTSVPVGIPARILCVESLKPLLPPLFCLLYALHDVITDAQLMRRMHVGPDCS